MKKKDLTYEKLLQLHDGNVKEFEPENIVECGNDFIRYTESYKEPKYANKQIRSILEAVYGEQFTIITRRTDHETFERIYLLRTTKAVEKEQKKKGATKSQNK